MSDQPQKSDTLYTEYGLARFHEVVTPAFLLALLDRLEAPADRVEKLEAENARLRAIIDGCDWYWPADDTSSDACADGPYAIAEDWSVKPGDVFAYSRGGVVETRYYAFLPADDRADSDDEFIVDEATEEAAQAKIKVEMDRRAALLTERSQS
jgi:hypothetical protein